MSNPMNVDLGELMARHKCDVWGVADLTEKRQEIERFIGRTLPAQKAIVFGRAVVNEYIDRLPEKGYEYFRCFNYVLLHELNCVSASVVEWLRERQCDGVPVHTGSCTVAPTNAFMFIRGITKMAARLAGLAWIGKSSCLVSPQFGPRLGWSCVLTSAPLDSICSPLPCRCGDCRRCIDNCPVGAITDRGWFDERVNPTCGFDANKCWRDYRKTVLAPMHKECCICMMVCPHGKNFAKRYSAEQPHAADADKPRR